MRAFLLTTHQYEDMYKLTHDHIDYLRGYALENLLSGHDSICHAVNEWELSNNRIDINPPKQVHADPLPDSDSE